MNRLFLSGLVSLALLPTIAKAADGSFVNPAGQTFEFVNNGSINTPQIDAINFINNGTFTAITILPFETASTLNFTNNGSMSGTVGWWFSLSPASVGIRRSAANFFNGNQASIFGANSLWIFATNIVSSGSLAAGSLGQIKMEGTRLNLTQSQIRTTPVAESPTGSTFPVNTNQFIPDVAIEDVNWAATNNLFVNSLSIWTSVFSSNVFAITTQVGTVVGGFILPPFTNITTLVTNISTTLRAEPPAQDISGISTFIGPGQFASWINNGTNNPIADSTNVNLNLVNVRLTNYTVIGTNVFTNYITVPSVITNLTRQAVFVRRPSSSDFRVQQGFGPGTDAASVGVLLSLRATNLTTTVIATNYLFFRDTLASEPGRGLLVNSTGGGFRPTNYLVERLPGSFGLAGEFRSGGGPPPLNFFSTSGNREIQPTNLILATELDIDFVTNSIITNADYSVYSAFIDTVPYRPPAVLGGSVTNLPGSIRIKAKRVDLSRARMSADGLIAIEADTLISSNAVLDCENLSLNIGSNTGDLLVQNLAPRTTAGRLRGTFSAESAFWTNSVNLVFSNNYAINILTVGSNTVPEVTNQPVVLTISVGYHVVFVDAQDIESPYLPVHVYDFLMRGTHVVFNDSAEILQSFLVDGASFTLNGQIVFPGSLPPLDLNPSPPIQQWINTNAPTLLHFTNNGSLFIPNEAHFGDDRPQPYLEFVNRGSISAASLQVHSDYFENRGSLSSGPFSVESASALLRGGEEFADGTVEFRSASLVFRNSNRLFAKDALTLTVTNLLTDNGTLNYFVLQNGFNLPVKPRFGDLMGSTVFSIETNLTDKTIVHRWAGENRGPTGAGYVNNVAIGTLNLRVVNPATKFRFTGADAPGVTNGLYVDVLDVTAFGQGLGLNQLQIDPNLIIYFASLRGPTNILMPVGTNGFPMLPEEFVENQFPGRLRWVRSFAGPNSSTTLISGGATNLVNRALRESQNIDSDGDGTPNDSDATPFAFASLGVAITGNGTVAPSGDVQSLIVGETYALVAQPAEGSKFLRWIVSGLAGNIDTTSPLLSFVMPAGGVNVTAEFAFVPTAASHTGLFYGTGTNGIEFERSGYVTLTTTKKGNYTGALRVGPKRYAFNGKFDENGAGSASAGPFELQLQGGNDAITGVVTNEDFTANLWAFKNVFNGRSQKAPTAGKYTVIFPGSQDGADAVIPQGDGFGAVMVNPAGRVKLSGELADGTKISQTAVISRDGMWPLYAPLYKGNGQILGWVTITKPYVDGWSSWIKLANTNAAVYTDGFNLVTNVFGFVYDPALKPVTEFDDALLILEGGDLPLPLVNHVRIGANNKVVNPRDVKLTLSPSQGLFRGSVLNTNTGESLRFSGAILQTQGIGLGHFRGRRTSSLSGQTSLAP